MSETPTVVSLDRDTGERFVALRAALGVTGFGINQLTLAPGQRMRIHRHAGQEEVYIVVDGRLTVFTEGDSQTIGVGEIMRVAPEIRRQLANTHRRPVTLIAIGSHGEDHHSRDAEAFTSWDETTGASPREVPLPEDLPASELRD